jgi:type IX secretion system PorP/SprF family membrane protein
MIYHSSFIIHNLSFIIHHSSFILQTILQSMKKILAICSMLINGFIAKAQQEAQFTQFMYNKLAVNPAFAAARRTASVTGIYRNQWMGFKGRPVTQVLSFDAPFLSNRGGIGVTVSNQKAGVMGMTTGSLAYSYDIFNTKSTSLRIGLMGAMRRYAIDLSDPTLYVRDGGDQALQLNGIQTVMAGNIGAGLYFDYKDFYVGMSAPYLYRNFLATESNVASPDQMAREQSHFYAMAGGLFKMSQMWHFKPAVMFKYVKNAPWSMDINASVMYNYRFSGGISYRIGESGLGDSVDALTFFQVTPQLGFGLGYDYSLSQLQKYNKGGAELLMRYDFGGSRNGGDLSNPRFFF